MRKFGVFDNFGVLVTRDIDHRPIQAETDIFDTIQSGAIYGVIFRFT
jgi:hypothetical protein